MEHFCASIRGGGQPTNQAPPGSSQWVQVSGRVHTRVSHENMFKKKKAQPAPEVYITITGAGIPVSELTDPPFLTGLCTP